MTTTPANPSTPAAETAAKVPPPNLAATDGLSPRELLEDQTEKRVDEIEMIGEEESAGYRPGASEVGAGMRFLHSSRTIHQLITDRNRAVALFLAVASLLWTASTALINAQPKAELIIPIGTLQYWCLPVTFGTLTVLALFSGLILVRTRVGLIYEVAKMNVLLGLPSGRVQRVNPLGIFFIMHLLISLAGGCSAGFFALQMFRLAPTGHDLLWSLLIGVGVAALLVSLYIGMVKHTTADKKLQGIK